MINVITWQWLLLILSSIIFFLIVPNITKKGEGFFKGVDKGGRKPGFWMLTASLFISWIFAKSITNAANLGLSFGIVGGLSYAMYYLAFLVAGIIIYKMRTEGNVKGIPQFIESKFGRAALVLFSVVIGIRLLNEIWSNTAVIGSYFGEQGSGQYTSAVIVFTLLTLAYALKGGLRSSLITDLIQMGLFAVLLFIVLSLIIPREGSVKPFLLSGEWTMATGLNLFFVAAIQIFSYPFHDPLMTDRGFISEPRTTLKSFIAAGFLGVVAITLFSFVGIYGGFIGVSGQAAVEVAKTLGVVAMLSVNFIMITSAASTLDSTFSSASKLAVVDLNPGVANPVTKGKWVMIITAIGGTIPLLFTPEILSATTISGTMVLGLAPIFLFWKSPAPKISFHLAIWIGIISGIVLIFGLFPESLKFTEGKYSDLLAINVYGTVLVFIGYLLPKLFGDHLKNE